MRYVLGVLLAVVFAAPAQARYLHKADAQTAAGAWVQKVGAASAASGSSLGRCWRDGAHVVSCSYYLTAVPGSLSDGADLHAYVVIALHGRRLRLHDMAFI